MKVFQRPQLIPNHFSVVKNGIELFPRFFLYQYYFVKDVVKDGETTMCENYVTVTDEIILYSPTQVEFSDSEKKKKTSWV